MQALSAKLKTPLRAYLEYFRRTRPKFSVAIAMLFGLSQRRWRSHLKDEIEYWNRWLETQGLQWQDDYVERLNPEAPLQDHVTELIDAPPGAPVLILDVGAGPLTSVGKRWKGRDVSVVAVDPLAAEYDRLLSKHGVQPTCRTFFAEAEALTRRFESCQFHLVHARNSLDHSFDPSKGISEMLEVVKPGCYVYLEHYIREAVAQNYRGLHQWNFFAEGGEFFISTPGRPIVNVTAALRAKADVQTEVKNSQWVTVRIKKHKE